MFTDPDWDPDADRAYLDNLQTAIDGMPEEIIGVSVAWVKQAFQKHHDDSLAWQDYLLELYANFALSEEALSVEASEIGSDAGIPSWWIELPLSILFEPVDWVLSFRDLMNGDPLALIGFLPLIPGISRYADEVVDAFRYSDEAYNSLHYSDEVVDVFHDTILIEERAGNIVPRPRLPDDIRRFESAEESIEWFNSRYQDTALGNLRRTVFGEQHSIGIDFTGAQYHTMEQALDELDELVELYPGASNITAIYVRPYGTLYPDGQPFLAYAARVNTTEIWLSAEIWGTGTLLEPNDALTFVAASGDNVINFQALTSHEYGHFVRGALENFDASYKNPLLGFVQENRSILTRLTPSTYEMYNDSQILSELFSEMFSARRVLDLYEQGVLMQELVHPVLLSDEGKALIAQFAELTNSWLYILR